MKLSPHLTKRQKHIFHMLAAGVFILALDGCVVGPDYKKPETVISPNPQWKLAQPVDFELKGDWWTLFRDPALDHLETLATSSNQLLQVAVARVDQSRAVARLAKSQFFPQVNANPYITQLRNPATFVPPDFAATIYTVPVDFSYEVDFWGRIKRSFQSAQAQAQAGVADYYNVLLILHGDVAENYFLLRQMDEQMALLQQTVGLREKSVAIANERYQAALNGELDLDQARTELSETQTSLEETIRQRANIQNALALLCGQSAASFAVAPAGTNLYLPSIPEGLPSNLLERRPDVAEAERKMASANEQIGVAKAAFFPVVNLTGDAGYSAFQATSLLNWESRLFQIGPQIALPLLNGGRLKAGLQSAKADYQAACANYQQQVLIAIKDVSDAFVNVDGYRREATAVSNTVAFACRSEKLARERYAHGLTGFLEVLEAQRTHLHAEIQSAQIVALEKITLVNFMKALGGGFHAETGATNLPPTANTTASN